MTTLLQSLVDGIGVGGLYALESLGIGLLFGIMRLANFALGAVTMAAAYALYVARDLPLGVAVLLAVGVAVLLSLLLEAAVFRRMRSASEAALFIASFAIAFGLENLALVVFGANTRSFSLSPWLARSSDVLGLRISHLSIVTLVAAGTLLLLFSVFLRRTEVGIRLRAAADDFEMTALLGVRAHRLIALAFALSGVLCAAVAVVVVGQLGGVSPGLGSNVVVIALLGAVIGGMDRLSGAAVGGFCVGFVLSLLDSVLPLEVRPFRDAVTVAVVVGVLVFRPQGLLPGGTLTERV
ncbi:MAG: branched-chain amino acid ABC transporter permease [Nocardioidaceae bacterium]|nr:branched-chain amino acid ABC transporter permease [Nocardioidaceae bacterium]